MFIFSGVEPSASDIARMKSQGLYDRFLQHETLRVLAPYMVLGVVVLVWALLIFRTRFPAIEGDSVRDQWAQDRRLSHAVPLSPLSFGCFRPVLLCRRAGGHMELLHPVCAGLHACCGKAGGLSAHHNARGVRGRPIRLKLGNEALPSRQDAGCIRYSQHPAGLDRNSMRPDGWA